MDTVLTILALVGAYLVGGIPFGLLLPKYGAGVDVRRVGSGNIGATNVARTLGFKWGLAVLLLDAAKGAGPALLFPLLVDDHSEHVRVGCGLAAILGHVFPVWLGFRGGKGVATALGVVLVLAPLESLLAAGGFAVTVGVTGYVALASVVASVLFAASHFVISPATPFSTSTWSLDVFSLLAPVLIVVRHRGNLARLWNGTEPRFRFGRRSEDTPPASPANDESASATPSPDAEVPS